MTCAKNYETVSTFVEVMQKKLRPLFSEHGVFTRTTLYVDSTKLARLR